MFQKPSFDERGRSMSRRVPACSVVAAFWFSATFLSAADEAAKQPSEEMAAYVDPGEFLPSELSKPCTRDFDGATLEEVITFFESTTGMPFRLDDRKLNDAGVGADTEIHAKS